VEEILTPYISDVGTSFNEKLVLGRARQLACFSSSLILKWRRDWRYQQIHSETAFIRGGNSIIF
jgi:hypothetical protein